MDLLVAVAAACLLAKPQSRNASDRRNEADPRTEPDTPMPSLPPAERLERPTEQPPALAVPEPLPRPMPEFHLCLVASGGAGAQKRRLTAMAGSVLVHGAVLIAVILNGLSGETPKAPPHYRLQILHLQPPTPAEAAAAAAAAEELWSELHPLSPVRESSTSPSSSFQSAGGQLSLGASSTADASAGPRRNARAPQTLIVEGAPPELKLNQAIPLPLAVSWTALQPLPPKQEQVRLNSPQAPTVDAARRPPDVKVIALPEAAQLAPDAVTIPKVNQSDGQDSRGRNSTGTGGTKAGDAAAGEAARARAAAEDAARALAAAEQAAQQARAAADEAAARARAATEETARLRAANEGAIKAAAAAASAGTGASATAPTSSQTAAAVPSTTGQPGADDPRAVDAKLARIELPPDGKARSAVLGESPQMLGRIVATIYLRVGLRKNWTLEYWSQGSTAGLDAPWAYTMFRPNLTLPADADALLVRGRLNTEGRLEQLGMLAPTEWGQKDSLFQALAQWKFRPAAKNGQAIAVDVLLVIPRQEDE